MRFAVPKPPQPDGRAARTSGSAKRGIERTGSPNHPLGPPDAPSVTLTPGAPVRGPHGQVREVEISLGDRGSHDPSQATDCFQETRRCPGIGLASSSCRVSPSAEAWAMRAGEPLILTPMRDPPDRPSRLALGGDGADDRSGTSATQRQSRYGPRGQPQWADWTGTPRLSGRRNAPDARQAPLTTR